MIVVTCDIICYVFYSITNIVNTISDCISYIINNTVIVIAICHVVICIVLLCWRVICIIIHIVIVCATCSCA